MLTPGARAAPLPGPAVERPPPSLWDLLSLCWCLGPKGRGPGRICPARGGKGGGASGLTLGSWGGVDSHSASGLPGRLDLALAALRGAPGPQGPGHSLPARSCPGLRPVAVAVAQQPRLPPGGPSSPALPASRSAQPCQGRPRRRGHGAAAPPTACDNLQPPCAGRVCPLAPDALRVLRPPTLDQEKGGVQGART